MSYLRVEGYEHVVVDVSVFIGEAIDKCIAPGYEVVTGYVPFNKKGYEWLRGVLVEKASSYEWSIGTRYKGEYHVAVLAELKVSYD